MAKTAKTQARPKAIARRRTPITRQAKAPPSKPARKAQARKSDVPTKLARIETALRAKGGATISDLMEATGWQAHSVRGALAGVLKSRGLDRLGENRRRASLSHRRARVSAPAASEALWTALVARAEALHDSAVVGQRRASARTAARLARLADEIATLARAAQMVGDKRTASPS